MKNSKKIISTGTLAAVIAVGVAAPSFARGHGDSRGYKHSAAPRVHSTSASATLTAEQQTYVTAVKAARAAYKSEVRAAETAYKAAKKSVRATYLAALATATSDAEKEAARDTYKAEITAAKAVKFAAKQAAALTRDTAVANAAATYTTATGQDPSTIPVPFGKK